MRKQIFVPAVIGGGGSSVTYLFRDEFTTAESAPLTSPRTCEPGPGTMTIVDTANGCSISSGQFITSLSSTDYVDPHFVSVDSFAIADGLAAVFRFTVVTGKRYRYGWAFSEIAASSSWNNYFATISNYIAPRRAINMGLYTAITPGTLQNGWCIMAAGGTKMFFVLDDTFVAVDANDYSANDPTYVGHGYDNAPNSSTIEWVRAMQLGAPWDTEYGIATNRNATPSSGDELTHEADCLAEVTWTCATGATFELDVRRTDADNRWIFRLDEATNTEKIIERNAGVETERASVARTLNNGSDYRVHVKTDGTNISGVAAVNYTSASFNQTATTAKITASAGAVSNFVTYPRKLTGAALAELQKWTA